MIKISTQFFKWSENEQVYPFHLAEDSSPLYCKKIDIGTLPNDGQKFVSHNISNFEASNLENWWAYFSAPGITFCQAELDGTNLHNHRISVNNTTVEWRCGHWSSYNGYVYLIYRK